MRPPPRPPPPPRRPRCCSAQPTTALACRHLAHGAVAHWACVEVVAGAERRDARAVAPRVRHVAPVRRRRPVGDEQVGALAEVALAQVGVREVGARSALPGRGRGGRRRRDFDDVVVRQLEFLGQVDGCLCCLGLAPPRGLNCTLTLERRSLGAERNDDLTVRRLVRPAGLLWYGPSHGDDCARRGGARVTTVSRLSSAEFSPKAHGVKLSRLGRRSRAVSPVNSVEPTYFR